MKIILAIVTVTLLGATAMFGQEGVSFGERGTAVGGTTRPSFWSGCCVEVYDVREPYYGARAHSPIFFYLYWGEDETQTEPQVALGWTEQTEELDAMNREEIQQLAFLPKRHWPLKFKFTSHQCMEDQWQWRLELVDTLGIVRGVINRDCNQKLHAVVNDYQVNLPREVQVTRKQRQPVGTVE